mmetsp:Transcript_10554/g.25783  ORF Transcript_10554/g.25783 Transcript_10554/m.25783 type:complete len:856 (-) Transcript_10554:192-2759(-)
MVARSGAMKAAVAIAHYGRGFISGEASGDVDGSSAAPYPPVPSSRSPQLSTLGLTVVWVALCSTLVWTRFENIIVFASFCIAIVARAVVGAATQLLHPLPNTKDEDSIKLSGTSRKARVKLAGAVVGVLYAALHSALLVGIVTARSNDLTKGFEYFLLSSAAGYLCMTLFDRLMHGLVDTRAALVEVVDAALLLTLLTAQFHRGFRIPGAVLIYLSFPSSLCTRLLEVKSHFQGGPRSNDEGLVIARASLLMLKVLPRTLLLVDLVERALISLFFAWMGSSSDGSHGSGESDGPRLALEWVECAGSWAAVALLSANALFSLSLRNLRPDVGTRSAGIPFNSSVPLASDSTAPSNISDPLVSSTSFPKDLSASSSSPPDSFPSSYPITNTSSPTAMSARSPCHEPNPRLFPPANRLWIVGGNLYDLGDYAARHPGGKAAIMLGRGRDATALFLSYHPFTEKHLKILKKYEVTNCLEGSTPRYKVQGTGLESDKFYNTLCKRVAKVLKEAGVDASVASPSRWAYYIIVMAGTYWSYRGYIRGNAVMTLLFAVGSWLMGAMGHDASHFAISHRPWVNHLCLSGMAFLCSPILWLNQHTYAHHSHTNDFHRDPDIHHFPFLRTHHLTDPNATRLFKAQIYRFYVWSWYVLITLGECIWLPIRVMVTESLYGFLQFPGEGFGLSAWAASVLHLVGFWKFVVDTPFRRLEPWVALGIVVLYLSLCGMFFGVFSQINHLNHESVITPQQHHSVDENESKKEKSKTRKVPSGSWAAEQVLTSNNFCLDSKLWTLLANGLNYQIEHHLFPGLNHEHLRLIAPVVQETCCEFGVQYKSFTSFSSIAQATLRYYRDLATSAELKSE